MLEDYQNKVCVVTGAASGIGKALCEKLVALGAQVYALDRNKADIEGLSAFVETDLSDKGIAQTQTSSVPQHQLRAVMPLPPKRRRSLQPVLQ